MPLREARELILLHGGRVVSSDNDANTVLIGDRVAADKIAAVEREATAGETELLSESQFLRRLLDANAEDHDEGVVVRDRYSLSMLAEVVGAPLGAIRRWWRRGYLVPTRELGLLPLFDLSEARVARSLNTLLASAGSLAQVDTWVAELETHCGAETRPLLSLTVEVHSGRLLIRDNGHLIEPNGQRVVDFEAPVAEETPIAIPVRAADASVSPESLRTEAWELADRGDHQAAVEACRLLLLSDDARAEDHFLLAQLLYEQGDATAARERYYAAIECDDSFVEARINLGCVLDELGDAGLATAVLQGAVDAAPEFADAHYHLAGVLDRAGKTSTANDHWRRFLQLSPDGPWSDRVRERLASND